MAAVSQIRELLVEMLLEVDQEERYSHLVLRETLEKYQFLPKQHRAFITRVFEGTIENRIQIDYWINGISSVGVDRMKPMIREIIRVGAYQIVYMDSVPDSAACNEAVKLTQKKGFYNLKGFVNGVLRNISRQKERLPLPSKEFPRDYLSVRYSMPEWLVRRWLASYGKETTEAMLEAFLQERPTTVRCRQFCTDQKDTEAMLRDQGVTVQPAPWLPYARYISGFNYIPALYAFREGRIQVQDVSSMLVGELAAPRPGDRVLDMCAAPGGKSLHVADMLKGTGFVEARDLTEYKVGLIEENIERSGVINVAARRQDATIPDRKSVKAFDIVLADLPCSGLGVIGKKTDIKYRITPDRIRELVQLQRQMLHNAADYVKPGGLLIYSTCTICEEENEENVQWFLSHYPFTADSLEEYLPEELKNEDIGQGCIQILPGIHGADGFFIARMRRNQE